VLLVLAERIVNQGVSVGQYPTSLSLHEERTRLADGLEVAVHFDRAGAVPIAEHAPVHLGAQAPHLVALVGGGELAGLLVVTGPATG
jgi:hypothetical protein